MDKSMKKVLKYIFIGILVIICFVYALFEYSVYRDKQNFSEAKNECERGCVQDSGGFPMCREICKNHPDHYP